MAINSARGYSVDYASRTIVLAKTFSIRVQNLDEDTCETLEKLQALFPGFKIRTQVPPKKKMPLSQHITFPMMEKYIAYAPNSKELLKQFSTMKKFAKEQKNPYFCVRDWFLEMFPMYGTDPRFNADGELIIAVADPATIIQLAEARRKKAQAKTKKAATGEVMIEEDMEVDAI